MKAAPGRSLLNCAEIPGCIGSMPISIHISFRIFISRRSSEVLATGSAPYSPMPAPCLFATTMRILSSAGVLYPFWQDKRRAFSKIYRVLKPGAVAYIGRGFSENLPVATAKKIRGKQRGKMKYDMDKAADELRQIMKVLQIKEWKIHRPNPPGGEIINYGIWIEFHKPKS